MIRDNQPDQEEIARRLNDTEGVTAALKKAARDAIQSHAQAGRQVVVWKEGEIVWVNAPDDFHNSQDDS